VLAATLFVQSAAGRSAVLSQQRLLEPEAMLRIAAILLGLLNRIEFPIEFS
jgi:hypothetical protein